MPATLKDLAIRLRGLSAGLAVGANEVKKEVARAVTRHLIRSTPVDTSRALSNWQVGASVASEIPPHVLGTKGSSRGASMVQAEAEAEAAISAARPGVPLVISNSVPYVRYLNEGSSSQSPGGFVEAALVVGKRTAQEAKLTIKKGRRRG